MHPYPDYIIEKFYNSFDKGKKDQCWIWYGSKQPMTNTTDKYYGRVWYKRQGILAHRLAWMLKNQQPIPVDKFVCHRCGNSICVNPHHLYLGTPQSNCEDMLRHGTACIGSKSSAAKLTEGMVVEIRKLCNDGKIQLKEIARQYGITYSNLWCINSRKTWTHI